MQANNRQRGGVAVAALAAVAAACGTAAAAARCDGNNSNNSSSSTAEPKRVIPDVKPVHGTTTKKWHFWKGRVRLYICYKLAYRSITTHYEC
jgi:ABC-type glycerol-3-phosphate transport system substrate-binding protein